MSDTTPEVTPEILAACAVFGAGFNHLADLEDPLLAVVQAARLKGQRDVLRQIGVLDAAQAAEASALIDITLKSVHDTFLDWKIMDAPGGALMQDLRDEVRKL